MSHVQHMKSAPWFVAILISLLVLGHACELSAFADFVAHAAEATHDHATDHDSDEGEISCDVVDAANRVSSQASVDVASVGAIAGDASLPARLNRLVPRPSVSPPPRPSLFLLHRSLLI